jgi:hypothetical protein
MGTSKTPKKGKFIGAEGMIGADKTKEIIAFLPPGV